VSTFGEIGRYVEVRENGDSKRVLKAREKGHFGQAKCNGEGGIFKQVRIPASAE
jgi:hypothetical protein